TRELVDRVAAPRRQPRELEGAVDRGADVGHPVEAREDRKVVLDGDVDVEVVELRHDAHFRPGDLRFARRLVAEEGEEAGVGQGLAGQQPHRRRLAGAVRSEQAEADALRHLEIETVDSGDRPEPLNDPAKLYRRHGTDAVRLRRRASGGGARLPAVLDEQWIRALHVETMRERELHSEHEAHVLFQASTIAALLDGAYDGDLTFGELAEHGDLGLGTLNGLDGEMIALDGRFYRAAVDGTVAEVPPGERTPFAVVTAFTPTIEAEIGGPLEHQALLAPPHRLIPPAPPPSPV